MYILKLSDKQFDSLEQDTRRSIMQQLMFVQTPLHNYSLGASGNWWTMIRRDQNESIGTDKYGRRQFPENYEGVVTDRWT